MSPRASDTPRALFLPAARLPKRSPSFSTEVRRIATIPALLQRIRTGHAAVESLPARPDLVFPCLLPPLRQYFDMTLRFVLLSVYVGFAVGFPVASQDNLTPHALLTNGQVFISGHLIHPAPSAVHAARGPRATIFNHVQDNGRRQLKSSTPQSASLIFAHDQWEDRAEQQASERHPRPRDDNDDENVIFAAEQWDPERREELDRRNDISAGPVFFAKGQWDE
ncbi:hypothetical protein GGX14DRAFT_423131 [Mycena pura]|uniref:Uncharacterized protein n=1 Tax=Mycena pura TaxID=153505 RepID=A0AAD6YQ39_9AGAR|nr:hypothetical protein GGX14DRAFT_423131 [Mycena pura]